MDESVTTYYEVTWYDKVTGAWVLDINGETDYDIVMERVADLGDNSNVKVRKIEVWIYPKHNQ